MINYTEKFENLRQAVYSPGANPVSMTNLLDLAVEALGGVFVRSYKPGAVDYRAEMNLYLPTMFSFPGHVPGTVSSEENTNGYSVEKFRQALSLLSEVGISFSRLEGAGRVLNTDAFSLNLRRTVGGFGPLAVAQLSFDQFSTIALDRSVLLFQEAAMSYKDEDLGTEVSNRFFDLLARASHN